MWGKSVMEMSHVPVVWAHVSRIARSPHPHGPVVTCRGRALSSEAEWVMEAGVHCGGGGWVGGEVGGHVGRGRHGGH